MTDAIRPSPARLPLDCRWRQPRGGDSFPSVYLDLPMVLHLVTLSRKDGQASYFPNKRNATFAWCYRHTHVLPVEKYLPD